MNKNIFFIIISLFISYSAICQGENHLKREISKSLHKTRAEKNRKELKEDSTLSKIAKYSNDYKLYKKRDEKMLVRAFLNGQLNFDEEFQVFNLKIKTSDTASLEVILNNLENMKGLLENDNYNKVGIDVVKKRDNFRIQIILSQNYIEYSEVSITEYISYPFHTNRKFPYKVSIKGKTDLSEIYYIKGTDLKEKSQQQKSANKKKVSFKHDNYFELELEYNNEDIEFYDVNGKTISSISNLLK